ncbi:MAG TPA: flagellar basal body P-ring protein FlgI [Terriglobia bacterium]|nr:flagellar basal body P-ring protein FlgI [Terriglobia bacterium]
MNHFPLAAAFAMTLLAPALRAAVDTPPGTARVRELATIEGVRNNPLLGYGVIVGLNGTGDRQQTIFSSQTLANVLRRMGVQVPSNALIVKNVAAVFVTATLPPFARPGMQIDVTVSSAGDAKSLEGGYLLLTPLRGADGQVYAAAQGPVTVGGYTAGLRGNSTQVNHPTVGTIPAGAIVEQAAAVDLSRLETLSLLLRDQNFATATAVAQAINEALEADAAAAVDGRRIEVRLPAGAAENVSRLIAQIEDLPVPVHSRAKVVVNERTGTVVMGRDVRLGPVSILHGNLSIEIATVFEVSQPNPFAEGETVVVPQTTVRAQEETARRVQLNEGATVEDLVRGLQAIGATPRDIVAILAAIKAAGALQADFEVI